MYDKLHSKYFRHLESKVFEGVQYTCYHPLQNPIILYSDVDNTPLAAIHFLSEKSNVKTIIANREDSTPECQKFQCMINEDNQVFKFVITNLCKDGCINFNILRDGGYQNDKINPGAEYGINQINELRPLESTSIKSDQKNNKKMILNSVDNCQLSIKQDEENAKVSGGKPKGTYFYLCINPEINRPEMSKRYAKTSWRVSDYMVVKTPYVEPLLRGGCVPPYIRSELYRGQRSNEDFNERYPSLLPMSLPWQSSRNVESASRTPSIQSERYEMEDDAMDEDVEENYILKSSSPKRSDNMRTLSTQEGSKIKKSLNKSKSLSNVTNSQIMNSSAATIGYGESYVPNGQESGTDYDYSVQSIKCMIGLSVQKELQFFPFYPKVSEALECINEFRRLEQEDLIESIKKKGAFKEPNCVICMVNN
jgi:hypothetical protein